MCQVSTVDQSCYNVNVSCFEKRKVTTNVYLTISESISSVNSLGSSSVNLKLKGMRYTDCGSFIIISLSVTSLVFS